MNISEVMSDTNARWQYRNPPAIETALQEFLSKCLFTLPDEYVELISHINGGGGELSIDPGWFQLWPIEEVLEANGGYAVEEYHSGYFGFGSSGGGVMFAFNINSSKSSKVFGIPFDSIDPEDRCIVAEDFLTFAKAMGYSYPDHA